MAITRIEAKNKIEAIVNKMKDEINEVQSSKPFTDYLNFVAKQYEYSFYNTLLIWSKAKNEIVMSGKKWNSMNRTIKDYSKKIWILAPIFTNTSKDKDKNNSILTGFKWVYIFSESNTEGDAIPACPVITSRNMQSDMQEYKSLVMACGYPIIEKDIKHTGCLGYTNGKQITIEQSLSEADKFMTLVHELSHALNHYGDNRKELSKEQKELEAESITYIMGKRLGIDTQVNVNYMAIYKKDYDLMASIGAIVKTVGSIEKMINADSDNVENDNSNIGINIIKVNETAMA